MAGPALQYPGKFVVRTLGTIFLSGSVLMLVLGQTILADELFGPMLAIYWTWCFLLNLLAAIMAVVDMAMIRRAGQQSRRELFRQSFTPKD
jgi:hypothetical protein